MEGRTDIALAWVGEQWAAMLRDGARGTMGLAKFERTRIREERSPDMVYSKVRGCNEERRCPR